MPCGGGWARTRRAAHTCPTRGSGSAGEAGTAAESESQGKEPRPGRGRRIPGDHAEQATREPWGRRRHRVSPPQSLPRGGRPPCGSDRAVCTAVVSCGLFFPAPSPLGCPGGAPPLPPPMPHGDHCVPTWRRPRAVSRQPCLCRHPTRLPCARSTAASCCRPTATRTCTTGCTHSTPSWPGPYGTRLPLQVAGGHRPRGAFLRTLMPNLCRCCR